ncbi:MAG: PKD domain-containing protein [Chloroflexi bacterium]|nr:PKD domain-containing protein [Chloroflexota bacterium]
MTEFADLVAELDYFESRGIHWTAWLFHDKFCPCMLTDSNTFDTTNYGEEIKIRLQAAAEQDGAPPDPTTPVLSTANAQVNIGQTVDVDLVLDIAPGGMDDFDLSLSMSSASAIIVGAVLAPEFSHALSNTIANVDRLVGVDFADAFTDGATSIRLATLTIEGASKGNAKLVITVNSMNDDANVSMAPNISGGTIDVNGSPVVDAGPDVTIGEQDAFIGAGSITDSDDVSWTATVDYGDGTGVLALQVSGNEFTLSHTYGTAGEYTVIVVVKDGQEATGSDSLLVTVTGQPLQLPGMPAPVQDLDGDGKAEDINGNGRLDFADLVTLFQHLNSPVVQDNPDYFDYNDNGKVDMGDVLALFNLLIA